MRFLKKMLIALALIVVLALVKKICTKLSPDTHIFHQNLFGSLQLMSLLWAIFTGLLESVAWKKKSARKAFVKSFIVFGIVIIITELCFAYLLHNPGSIPHNFTGLFGRYYNVYERDIVQYNRATTAYDTSLFYRLKANNRSVFRNFEFADSIFTNNLGLRNKPVDIKKIKTICLGDSYTFGWGVQQDEAFPQQLEKILQAPVLNTGVSSYGTAREIESIRHLGLQDVENIIIQHCNNDYEENDIYIKDNYHLRISPIQVYDSACTILYWGNLYFPGKYFCTISKMVLKGWAAFAGTKKPEEESGDLMQRGTKDAHSFLEILKRSGWNFGKTRVIVFSMDEQNKSIPFIASLERELALPENASFFKGHLLIMHVASLLTPADYYILDDHLRASGHAKIARQLAGIINAPH